MPLSLLNQSITEKEQEFATEYLENAYTDVPGEIIEKYSKTTVDLLMYELNKCIATITKYKETSLNVEAGGLEASKKSAFTKMLTHSGNIYNRRDLIIRKVHEIPEGEERDLIITDRYAKSIAPKGKVNYWDRGFSNIASLNVLGYATNKEYSDFLETLEKTLSHWLDQGYTLQSYFFHIKKDTQALRLLERKNDPTQVHKFSLSDARALDLYDEFSKAYLKLVDGYYNAGVPFTIIKTDDPDTAFINWLREILRNLDYEKKSKNIDFIPDSEIVIANREEVKKVLETKNDS